MWNPYQNAQRLARLQQQQAYNAQGRQQPATRPQPQNTDADLPRRMQQMGIGQTASRSVASTSAPATSTQASTARTDPDAWQKPLQFLGLPDNVIMQTHSFARAAITATHHGRMRRIHHELTILKDSLPPGIFVRYANSRPDLMKILILGPEDSPYENGVFEFDLFCGPQFPLKPPSMLFRTTGGGSVTFNPNLYDNGQVCLSILGTWEGRQWHAGIDSIMGILIAIQSHIFTAEPWYNETGREKTPDAVGRPQSKAYNKSLWPKTVKWGMIDWIEKLGTGGIWNQVVRKHFESKGTKVLDCAWQWVREGGMQVTRSGTALTGLTMLAQRLGQALLVLERNAMGPAGALGGFGGIF